LASCKFPSVVVLGIRTTVPSQTLLTRYGNSTVSPFAVFRLASLRVTLSVGSGETFGFLGAIFAMLEAWRAEDWRAQPCYKYKVDEIIGLLVGECSQHAVNFDEGLQSSLHQTCSLPISPAHGTKNHEASNQPAKLL
jgi:hypothetical protein